MGYRKSLLALIFLLLAPLTCLSTDLPSEYSIVKYDQEFLSEERVVQIFELWKEKYGKVYNHAQEAERRLGNFRTNLKYILEKNANRRFSSGHRVGLNKFADLSNEEFKQRFLSKVKIPVNKRGVLRTERQRRMENCEAPSSLDWRMKGAVTGVKDQGSCGKLL
ncbi:hypothetical protein K2173_001592 [Erythroxylum novogranatense]|uniref:Cathepsin propeptide inhibitor domain-containing protein n=1 Tax=Erythroxylum novogranatense TaxID=1862640 RepID=A0AAV8T5V6_9ROSI|nr:hypothetical protein K2173_001592 [Erythroxylum novogranatense]